MTDIITAIRERILVGDGAMGTALMAKGLEAGMCMDLWNADNPQPVIEVLSAYREAGADMLTTNTFGANRWKLSAYDAGDRVAEVNAAAVEVARKAADGKAFVLGDVGPTGRFMEPLGTDPRSAFVEVFAEQASALAAAGADAIILETFTALDEMLAAVEAAAASGVPVIASMSYSRDAAGTFHTMMGNDIPSSTAAIIAAGASVVAANCGTGPEDYLGIAAELCRASSVPVMIQPNAGVPQLVEGKTVFPMSADELGAYVERFLDIGVRVIGGCCGTTAEHIAAIRAEVDRIAS
jgi:5-methyltetrahydrofolate--homocysteine methyltransferase